MAEPVWANGKIIGTLNMGVFTQTYSTGHIFRKNNAKGLDVAVYRALLGKCKTWRIINRETKTMFEMPFNDIGKVGTIVDTKRGYGSQYMVGLDNFTVK